MSERSSNYASAPFAWLEAARDPAPDLRSRFRWCLAVSDSVGKIERTVLAAHRQRSAERSLQLVATRPLDLLRWGFRQAGVDRDADLPPRGHSFRENVDLSDFNSPRAVPAPSGPVFLSAEQWALISPLLPRSEIDDRRSSLKRGRPPASPRPLLEAIFWRAAHHARWQDLPSGSPPMLTCRRYYRRLFLSGRLFTIYKALYQDFLARSGADLAAFVQQGYFAVSSRRIVLAPGLPDSWQIRTAYLFMQMSQQNLGRLQRTSARECYPPRRFRPPFASDYLPPAFLTRLVSAGPGTGTPPPLAPRAEIPPASPFCDLRSLLEDPKFPHSFRENSPLSDFYSSPAPPSGRWTAAHLDAGTRPCPERSAGAPVRPARPHRSDLPGPGPLGAAQAFSSYFDDFHIYSGLTTSQLGIYADSQSKRDYRLCYTDLMGALSSDTHPKMEALQIQLWRQASPTRKMHMLAQLNASARVLALAGLRSRYPQENEAELRRRLAGLLLGEELARKVYGEIWECKMNRSRSRLS